MPRTMVHPRLKRILSESSSAVSSPPDTASDTGKPERESEDPDPEVDSPSHSNRKESDAEQEAPIVAGPESPGSRMDISDDDADGVPKVDDEDKAPVASADETPDTQKSGDDTRPRVSKLSPGSIMSPPPAEGGTLSTAAAPIITTDESPVPPVAPVKSTSRSSSQHSTKDIKDAPPMPPSTSASANRSPAPQPRPSLKIKLKLGARTSRVTSEAEAGEEKTTRGRRGKPRGSGKAKANGKGTRPLTFTLPPRPRTDPSEASSRPSISRSQSSQHSSVESEDEAEDADAESENENNAQPERDDQTGENDEAMDVDIDLPSLGDRLADDAESGGDADNPDDGMGDAGGDEDEVLPGGGKARLTARQAVLASMVGADHVELEAATSSRKKQLTSEEIALRREETARKRKNMSEKKLEDEKTETINRLLKKQSSRSRAKRSTLLNTSVVPTPQSPHSGDDGESDAVLAIVPGATDQKGTTIPGPVWRWVSNSSGIRLGIPSEAVDIGAGLNDTATKSPPLELVTPRPPVICNVSGCGERRRYRLVHDFKQGACGMEHLRVLTGAA